MFVCPSTRTLWKESFNWNRGLGFLLCDCFQTGKIFHRMWPVNSSACDVNHDDVVIEFVIPRTITLKQDLVIKFDIPSTRTLKRASFNWYMMLGCLFCDYFQAEWICLNMWTMMMRFLFWYSKNQIVGTRNFQRKQEVRLSALWLFSSRIDVPLQVTFLN